MCCKYGSDVDMSFPTERNSNTGLPFVKVGDNRGGKLASDVLHEMNTE
jgi:hypothetical protein